MKISSGLLPYRNLNHIREYFIVHPGGPFWKNKELNVWSVAKGECEKDENLLHAAFREFKEETGYNATGTLIELSPVCVSSLKTVKAWGINFDFDADKIFSNTFEIEWPPKSGKRCSFPEVDRGGWFNLDEAKLRMVKPQIPIIDELDRKLSSYRS